MPAKRACAPEMVGKTKRPVPTYVKIERYLRRLIEDGHGRVDPLPSEPDLARRFHVTRMTVRNAFASLVRDGLVVRFPRRGTFVNTEVLDELPISGSVGYADWSASAQSYVKRILKYELCPAPADVARHFALSEGAPLTYLEQMRIVDGKMLAIDFQYMLAAVKTAVSEDEIERAPLVVLLRQRGFPYVTARIEIDAHAASVDEGERLGAVAGAPVLERRTFFIDSRERLIAHNRTIYRAETFTYRATVRNISERPFALEGSDSTVSAAEDAERDQT